MKSRRYKKQRRERQPPRGWPDMLPLPSLPEPPPEPRPGDDAGYIEIKRDGRVVRIDLLEPGILSDGRRARSDTVALKSGEVLSLRAAALMAVAALPRRLSRKGRMQADTISRGDAGLTEFCIDP